ncbi:MAG: IS66 family insertion sequence element accessory protein TnpB [Gammaproteobacteria bacterium]|nr:IS66 family insertion sequence element accessory protein TnpB [Gammaproteobacteria bacterium]MDH5732113.1 IS66 family insertion sequence element accessory protein TnpB [Gammaproteobacteria bacterium]
MADQRDTIRHVLRPCDAIERIYLCREFVDMRKSINGLSVLVEAVLQLDPFSSHLFVFCNKKRDKIKMLIWERNGFVLWYKRLEKQRFRWPKKLESDVIELDVQSINWLLDGFDLSKMKPHQSLHFTTVL